MNTLKRFRRFHNDSENGAALVTVLMVSSLLLIACIGMLTAAAKNTKNVSDAIGEDQAYYAAESGLQATINVLRGNTCPSPLFQTAIGKCKSPAPSPTVPPDPSNEITFLKAITTSSSNVSGDTNPARLSRWLSYSSTFNDRVILGEPDTTYTEASGMAYSIQVSDPDNTQNAVTYSTSATFIPYDTEGDTIAGTLSAGNTAVTYTSSTGSTKIEFIGKPSTTLTFASNMASPDLGSFRVTRTGTGATISDALQFQIAYNLKVNQNTASRYIRGIIYEDNASTSTPKDTYIKFYSDLFLLMGSNITLTSNDSSFVQRLNRPATSGATVDSNITASVTPAEPVRLLVKSTGYGPHGARKTLEAIVQKNFFNDLSAPASLTLIGPDTSFLFKPGTSANVTYSGDDQVSAANIPAIGVTTNTNLQTVLTTSIKTPPDPPAADVSLEIPAWLSSPANLDATISSLRTVAKATGRYFPSGTDPGKDNFGSIGGTGITFVDGDVDLQGDGGGILVCTGKLTLDGRVNFSGLILVTGAGGIDRKGTGNGTLAGNTVVAPYNPSNLAAGFLSPKYDVSGGGTSELVYNSSSVANGLAAISNFVLGVAEK